MPPLFSEHNPTAALVDGDNPLCVYQEADQGARLREQMGLLTPDDLCAVLCVGPQTLALWRVKGVGPDFVKGAGTKAVFYRREDVQAWLAMNVVPSDRAIAA
jgi:hypothetical protein